MECSNVIFRRVFAEKQLLQLCIPDHQPAEHVLQNKG